MPIAKMKRLQVLALERDHDALLRQLEADPELYQSYVRRAGQLAETAHDPQTNRQAVCRLLQQVCAAGEGQP